MQTRKRFAASSATGLFEHVITQYGSENAEELPALGWAMIRLSMIAIAQAAVAVAMDILNGTADSAMSRVADSAEDPAVEPIVESGTPNTIGPPHKGRRTGWQNITESGKVEAQKSDFVKEGV